MQYIKILIVGAAKSGKTELFNILHRELGSPAITQLKLGQYYSLGTNNLSELTDNENPFEYIIYDNNSNEGINSYSYSTIVLYCLDLSRPIDFKQENEKLKNDKPNYIVIGTKADKKALENAPLQNNFSHCDYSYCEIDSKNTVKNNLFDKLFEEMTRKAKDKAISGSLENEVINNTDLSKAILQCELLAAHLPQIMNEQLVNEIVTLVTSINNNKIKTIDAEIKSFVNNCNLILNNKPHDFKKIIINLALTIAVGILLATLAFSIGLAIGFAVGVWTGPLAFLSALTAGSAAAITVLTTSLSLGVLTSSAAAKYLFFTKPVFDQECEKAVSDVAEKAKLAFIERKNQAPQVIAEEEAQNPAL